jgi:nucleoside-diphosphate-sugar epimerase
VSRFLVTGGAGFIGSHIVERLVEQGHDVCVIDNLLTGKRENISHVLSSIEFCKCDIRDSEALEKIFKKSVFDCVVHEAALPSVPRSLAEPILTHQINTEGTLNLLVLSARHKIKRFVYAASSSAYGDSPVLPKVESMPPKWWMRLSLPQLPQGHRGVS